MDPLINHFPYSWDCFTGTWSNPDELNEIDQWQNVKRVYNFGDVPHLKF